MKFTLQEKYILNERFNLSERFILTEDEYDTPDMEAAAEAEIAADEQQVDSILKNIEKIKELTGQIVTKINEENKNSKVLADLNPINDIIEDELKSGTDYTTVQGEIRDYLKKFDEISGRPNVNSPELTHEINVIRDLLTKTNTNAAGTQAANKEPFEELKTEYKKLHALISNVYNSDNEKYTKEVKDKIDELNKNIQDTKFDKHKLLILETDVIETFLDETGKQITGLTELKDKTPIDFTKFIEQLNSIEKLYQSISKSISTREAEDEKAKKERSQADARASSQKEDWAALYKNCKTSTDFDNFWKGYFKTEWGENAEKVDSFGLAFTQELKSLGFDSINNPFIKFLKEDDRISKFNINKDNYSTLHNAVAQNAINLKDLKGTGNFGKDNLIFNKNLYTQTPADMREYLDLQRRLINEENNLPDELKNAQANEKLNKTILNDDGTLRPITEAKQRITQLLGEKKAKIDVSQEKLINNIGDVDATTASKMLSYLCDYFRDQSAVDIDKLINDYPEIKNKIAIANPRYDEKRSYDDLLNLGSSGWDYRGPKLIAVLKHLAKQAGVDIKEEK